MSNNNTGTTIEGRHAVLEAMRSGRSLEKLYMLKGMGNSDDSMKEIARRAKKMGIVAVECDARRLSQMSETNVHQGVIAVVAEYEYYSLEELLNKAESENKKSLYVVCDGIEDPHNLGAIIRSASAVGASGIIISKHGSVGITATVAKAAAGALEHVAIAKVNNITKALETLKERGVWIYALSADGENNLYKTDLKGNVAIVVGSEGNGISRLVRETCDFIMRIPMVGEMESLNASVATAVTLFEAHRQRMNEMNGMVK